MSVYLAWVDGDLPATTPGPWTELRPAAPQLFLLESTESRSRVYHELKWALPDDAALLVVTLAAVPKLRGLAPGSQAWLRARLPEE